MILTRVLPGVPESVDLDDDTAREQLAAMYEPPRPDWLRLNFVASVNGSAAGSDGTSETLTNPADRALLGVIRGLADVVLVGAASVRAEGYRIPRRARLAIVTATGRLSFEGLDQHPAPRTVLVICPPTAARAVEESLGTSNVEVVVVPDNNGRLDPARIVDALHARGLRRIVGEGGPNFAAQLLNAGLVDELCLTTSPRVRSLNTPLLGTGHLAERGLSLTQLLVDDKDGVYARWTVKQAT